MLTKDFPRIDDTYPTWDALLKRYEEIFPQERPADEKKYTEYQLRLRDERVKKWLNRLSREEPSTTNEDLWGKIAANASVTGITQNGRNKKLQFQIEVEKDGLDLQMGQQIILNAMKEFDASRSDIEIKFVPKETGHELQH